MPAVEPIVCRRDVPGLPLHANDLNLSAGHVRVKYNASRTLDKRVIYRLSLMPADSPETAASICRDLESIARLAGAGMVCGFGEASSDTSVEMQSYGCKLVLYTKLRGHLVEHLVKSKISGFSSTRSSDYDMLDILSDLYGINDTVMNIFDCGTLKRYASRLVERGRLYLAVAVTAPLFISNISLEGIRVRHIPYKCISASIVDVIGFAEKLYESGVRVRTPVVMTGVVDRCYGLVLAGVSRGAAMKVVKKGSNIMIGRLSTRLAGVRNGLHLYLGGYLRVMPEEEYRDAAARERALRCEARRIIVPLGLHILEFLERSGVLRLEEVYRVE